MIKLALVQLQAKRDEVQIRDIARHHFNIGLSRCWVPMKKGPSVTTKRSSVLEIIRITTRSALAPSQQLSTDIIRRAQKLPHAYNSIFVARPREL